MFFTTTKRILRSGYLNFRRNGWLSTATITIMALALFVMGNLIFIGALSQTALEALESKIDITMYFVPGASERDILTIKKEIEAVPDVAGVAYVSRDQALAEFRERHKENAMIVDALGELDDNPLEASLNIQAKDSSQYAAISDFLVKKNYSTVEKINYFENKIVIEKLGSIIGTVRGAGALVALLLAFVAVLVAFNTIRLAIYTMREEIGIMRLVGATKWFIRGPFLVAGVIYGVIAAIITTLLFYPLSWGLAPHLAVVIPDFDIFQYYKGNIFEFFAIMLGTGLILGIFSSAIAIRRYLEV